MIEFFNRLFGRQPSGATAKERLRLVLMSDHLSLAPEMIDAMKRDLVDVISRYVEVDREKIDVHFEHQDKALAMLANIPITGVNRNSDGGSGTTATGTIHAGTNGTAIAEDEPRPEPVAAPPGGAEAAAKPPAPRRRKRRKSGGSGAPAPAT